MAQASAIGLRQRETGMLAKLLPRIRRSGADRTWTLPNGETAEQSEERRTDLLLVWSCDDALALDEPIIRARIPKAQSVRRIGESLFVVFGAPVKRDSPDTIATPAVSPRDDAERNLAAARQSGDRRREAIALCDLGAVLGTEGDARGSLEHLQQALDIIQEAGDSATEIDVLTNLGLARMRAGQTPENVFAAFNRARTLAEQSGDRLAEKSVLGHLGALLATLRNPGQAIPVFQQARTIARELGDRSHESNLLWQEAVQFAELGQSQEAFSRAEAAISIMRSLGKPDADWYAEHLRRFRLGQTGLGLYEPAAEGSATQTEPPRGPGLLRMAASAAAAMAKFLGSGMKTTPAEVARERLAVCGSCEHHTGLRCRVCGCYTAVKSKMLHEACPLGKWPSSPV
jgi:tetratricopeptide (TPR) repeat protein